ncbi:LPXTG cell wall anchor domain-containing protein [Streptomyces phyllanthi]|uniref:LPXTG cell wall anchor domain-containing protein n=1 Tax=Streptomyces phyllanthi TaxID=1803180 RepID=A0A5N8WCU7_9ACTN|nr:LPXTG cell wall anchor domain-containing protein [Streptomyces phyllanthi]MPY45139.1 LPXTG cell wall anchor domain-containing protein [Streptomyces phyllanthi]
MRTLIRAGALAVATSAALLIAPAAHATPLGEDGTVKLHDAVSGKALLKNAPHVCSFYVDAFGFGGVKEVNWRIEAWTPAGGVAGDLVKSGTVKLDSDGHGRTEDLSLPDGHYKLFWFDGNGGLVKDVAKHKVFWKDCSGGVPAENLPAPDESESASAPPSDAPGAADGGGDGGSGGRGADGDSGGAARAAAGSSSSSRHDLAETGSGAPVGVLAAVAVAFIAGGGFLFFRRRRGSQG